MIVVAHTDGASRGNPGESGIGVILRTPDGTVLGTISGHLGTTTNNIAEYSALLACLHAVAQLPCEHLIVQSDSELMVRQVKGQYKVRDAHLKKQMAHVRALLEGAPYRFEIRHILREQNADADELANEGIDTRQPVRVMWTANAPVRNSVK
jgi:ribonuclease HI